MLKSFTSHSNLKETEWQDRGTPMLTTFDNPYNPFTEFEQWYLFDELHHHNCCGYIERTALVGPGMTDREKNHEIEAAIDELLKVDFLDIYRKVFEFDFD